MRSLVFWKAMAEGWGGDLWKERNGLLGEKKNPPKACEADFHGDRSVLSGEKGNPPIACEADFGGWRSGLSLGKKKTPKAREEDLYGDRSVMSGEKERGDLEKVSFRCGKCSALRQPSHRTAFLASPFSLLSQGAIAFSVKRLSPPLPARRTSSGGAVKRKPPLAPSLCGKFKRGLCFILSHCIHPLTFP